MILSIDQAFKDHFRNLKQVFLYITDQCNLECEQCIYKPSINFFIQREIPERTAHNLLADFRELGASKVTFLGGEPTLYGASDEHRPLLRLFSTARSAGYAYTRIDTNGQFKANLLTQTDFRSVSEIAFSLDGYSPETNDPLRGVNTFNNCLRNIRFAVSLGYKVTITCCVQKLFVQRDEEGNYRLDTMIRFAQSLGLAGINFHDLFKVGIPMDTWTGSFNPTVAEWVAVYSEIKRKIDQGEYRISVRLPQCFVTRSEFDSKPEYYGYCPVKLGERVMVHPNGVIRICSNLICTAYGVARYTNDEVIWDKSSCNEIADHDLSKATPCTNRSRHKTYGQFVPLCFSFKPDQDEPIWKEQLHWDERRRTAEQCAETEK